MIVQYAITVDACGCPQTHSTRRFLVHSFSAPTLRSVCVVVCGMARPRTPRCCTYI